MPQIHVLADEITVVADGLATAEHEIDAVTRRLSDVDADDVGPAETGAAVSDALLRLERRLTAVTQELADGGRALRRHLPDEPSGSPA